MLFYPPMSTTMPISRLLKRLFDILGSGIFLGIFLVPMVLISILVLIFLGRPVFFKQERAGYQGKIFYIRKFRTMKTSFDSSGNLLPDSERLGVFGKILRASSLDELPELWNILIGEMSFVGPRPLLTEYLPLYSKEQARRHEAIPGLTGWAQVNGRNSLSWEQRFKLDVWYVDNWSLWLDIKVLFLTVWKVISSSGISSEGHSTMPKFSGTK